MAEYYASGTWYVKPGCDQEFVDRWTEFLQWTRKEFPSMLAAHLLRDRAAAGHYVSFAEWADEASRDAWRGKPEFAARYGPCRALCTDMTGANFDRVVTI
ncbi:antibiotic biosynthesis monooxygenase family protein [Nocardia nepalensis]|uniref:antibiotic biosynthesis monooxygenase family protein n=1 Tax=Nocardia nepalensis TaxID=3375448 RepID=UPI003B670BD9